jgi:hypothetical protein
MTERMPRVIKDLDDQLIDLMEERDAINMQIAQVEAALAALNGKLPAPRRSSPSARRALLSALASFDAPVHTSRLLDHELLVHYSRHTLRGVLTDLRRAGEISGERAPKGFIWDPRSAHETE